MLKSPVLLGSDRFAMFSKIIKLNFPWCLFLGYVNFLIVSVALKKRPAVHFSVIENGTVFTLSTASYVFKNMML